jgi:hypothetical protein
VLRDGDFTDDVPEVRRRKGEFYRFEDMCSPLSGDRAPKPLRLLLACLVADKALKGLRARGGGLDE